MSEAVTHLPAQNLDAEERVLGAILSAGALGLETGAAAVVAVRETGLAAEEFYRNVSHAAIYRAVCALADAGKPVDAVSVAAELEVRGELDAAGGKVRIHELAALCPAVSNAPRYARLIREEAERRAEWAIGAAIQEASSNGGLTSHPEIAERARRILDGRTAGRRLQGLTHAEALEAEIPATRELVEGLIDCGTIGGYVGLPYSRKSYAAQELGRKVAAGTGEVFGRPVLVGGPVVYAWQDDSTPKMLERVQSVATSRELPIRWLLNEDIRLPDDIPALRDVVTQEGAVLVVLDSLYNFLPVTMKLKDEEVAPVFAALKSGICDSTGATIAVVDHAPWPSEGNRGQRRSYGSVFKTAAVRWTIHLEVDGKDDTRLHVQAQGNNVAGFHRTPAYWDEDDREIRLLDVELESEEEQDAATLEYVLAHPGQATTAVALGLGKRRQKVLESLERLGTIQKVKFQSSQQLGTGGTGRYWYPFSEAGFQPSLEDGMAGDGSPVSSPLEGAAVQPSHTRRVDG